MKHELTAKRLQMAMNNTNITAQELSNKSGVAKSSISQYVNGSHKPSNISSGKLASILNVNPLWLMGFDVPKEIDQKENKILSIPAIMSYYNQLNTLGQEIATEQVRLLTLDKKYTEQNVRRFPSSVSEPDANYLLANAAHDRTDTDFTEEDRKADEDMLD